MWCIAGNIDNKACFISPVVLDSLFHLWEVTDPEIIELMGMDVLEFPEL